MDLKYEKDEISTLDENCKITNSNFYIDPKTKYTVIPTHIHEKRGTCCGNMCRHCPYDWVNVKQHVEK